MQKLIIYLVLIIAILSACKKVEMLDDSTNGDKPVVEGFLFPGQAPSILVTNIYSYEADSSEQNAITGLEIHFFENSTEFLLNETSEGTYIHNTLTIKSGKKYSFWFVLNSDTISSHTIIPEKPENFESSATSVSLEKVEEGEMPDIGDFDDDKIELTWDNPNNEYFVVELDYRETTPDYVMFMMEEMEVKLRPSSKPVIASYYEINNRQLIYFGKYYIVLYKITDDYAKLYESMSNNTQNLVNPPTNINNGWGIFTGVNSDTIEFKVNESK